MIMEDLQIIPSDSVTHLKVIGQGAYGTVTEAFHTDLGQIAIKKVVAYRSKPKQLKKLKEEARKLAQLGHPNIVRLHGFIESPEECGIVLEFCKYGSLYDLIDSYDCSNNLKIHFLHQIAQGMRHLHCQNPPVIHRDLKAANVLIGENLCAKLADFGLSEWRTVVRSLSSDIPAGTVTHIPPEKWEDINFSMNTKCDVYSFGILIWEVVMETAPFKDAKETQIQLAVQAGQRPSLEEFPDDVPPSFRNLMEKSWSQDPEERPSFVDIVLLMENELINEESFTQNVKKDKLLLIKEIHCSDNHEARSLPTNVVISKNHSCRQVEHKSLPIINSPRITTDGVEDDLYKAGPGNLENGQRDQDGAQKESQNANSLNTLPSLSGTPQQQSNGHVNGNAEIPATVQTEDPISVINQKVYSIVNHELGNNVETDSVPFYDSNAKTAPSGHYHREYSLQNKDGRSSDIPAPAKKKKVPTATLR